MPFGRFVEVEMPGTPQEYVALATYPELPGDWADDFQWADGTDLTREELLDVIALRNYYRLQQRRKHDKAQRKAMTLLKRFLDSDQRQQLRRNGSFVSVGPSGIHYRIHPAIGLTQEIKEHGSRFFASHNYCLHDDRTNGSDAMPPADVALSHILLIQSDEASFLRTANQRSARDQLWNGEYLRRLRRMRNARLDTQPAAD